MEQAADSLNHYADRLQKATADLWYPSEIDAPLSVVFWPVDQLDNDTLKQLLSSESESVNRQPPEQFFQPIFSNPFWRTSQVEHLAQRYEALQCLVYDTLDNLYTYRIGTVEVSLYLIGQHSSGGYVGLCTTVVET